MADHSLMKLGRQAPVNLPEALSLAKYKAAQFPNPPDHISWSSDIYGWDILANDILGDCTVAGVLHYIMVAERWRDGVGRRSSKEEAISNYKTLGYDPANPATDMGARLADVMQKWKTDGFSFCGENNKITNFARIDTANELHVRIALWLTGPLIVGARMPIVAQTQDYWTSPADLEDTNAPGSWGGHCMLLTAWDHQAGNVEFITWGEQKYGQIEWFNDYVDEAWAVMHPAWLAAGVSPSGAATSLIAGEMEALAYNPSGQV